MMNFQPQYIRKEVSRKGYGLEILVNDSETSIRALAKRKLEELKEN